jgi:hypothetical protein
MKVVYVAHPLGSGADREANRARAARWAVWAAEQGVAPVADWILIAGAWRESEEARARGLAIDCALVARCDEIWLVGGRISEGMRVEANAALAAGAGLRDLTELGEEPPASFDRSILESVVAIRGNRAPRSELLYGGEVRLEWRPLKRSTERPR